MLHTTGFPKLVARLRKRVGDEASGCDNVESLEPVSGQAVNEMVPSTVEDVGSGGFCRGTRKTSLNGFCH